MKCKECGKTIELDDNYENYFIYDGEYYCEECKEDLFVECEDCGKIIPKAEAEVIDYDYYCENCASEYGVCSHCGCWYRIEDMEVWDDDYFCQDCYDDCTVVCCECGERVWQNDATWDYGMEDWICKECENDNPIKGYHDYKSWHDFKLNNNDKSLKKGFELEIETCYATEKASALLKEFDDFFVYEYDGSVSGFEIISNPFTQNYQRGNIEDVANRLFDTLSCDFSNAGCGLHVHVNRADLATDKLSQEEVIDNIYLIMETFRDELTRFSRRKNGELREWAKFLLNDEEITFDEVKEAKSYAGRYSALNCQNRNTIEFRLFKGATNPLELIASLEMVDSIVSLAKGDVNGITWEKIISYSENVRALSYELGIESDKMLKVVYDFGVEGFEVGEIVEMHYDWKTLDAVVISNDYSDTLVYVLDERFNGHNGEFPHELLFGLGIPRRFWFCNHGMLKHKLYTTHDSEIFVGSRVKVERNQLSGITKVKSIYHADGELLYKVDGIDDLVRSCDIMGVVKFDNELIGKLAL